MKKKYAIIEITGGNPRYIGLFTVAIIFDSRVIAPVPATGTFASIHNSVMDTLMTPGTFKISKEISEEEYLQGTKKQFSSKAERVLDRENKKYAVAYTTVKSKAPNDSDLLSNVKYKDHWKAFVDWPDNFIAAEEFYAKVVLKKSFYSGALTEIIEQTNVY